MSGRGGRGRPQRNSSSRDYPPRSEDRVHHKRSNPPSRHIWIGNLSQSLSEGSLTNQLLRFGELESVSFQPGRSYAFVNFKHEEGAFAAMRQLQGSVIAGNAIRVEFAKAEKSTPLHRDEEYLQHRDEEYLLRRDEHPTVRGSPAGHREPRTRYSSPDPPYLDKPKASDRSSEPSEVLWIGFPSQLKVDEFVLRKAFSPFGEIDNITAFPGRTYAFVRFKNVAAASRARETLLGKLFGNPRVNICFAKSESANFNRHRSSMDYPSPHFRTHEHQEFTGNFQQERNFGNATGDCHYRSPRFFPELDSPSDPKLGGRKKNLWDGEDEPFERGGPPEHAYAFRTPPRKRHQDFRDFSPQFRRRDPLYDDDQWDLPEDTLLFRETKKLRTNSYDPDNELPEYPLSNSGPCKPMIYHHDYPRHDKTFDSRPLVDYRKNSEGPGLSNSPYGSEDDRWGVSHGHFQTVSHPTATNPELKRLSKPEPRPSLMIKEWKWEGTIAKGGSPVCRARCFPVGQPLDMNLPEYLDCTARTSLDMLSKHYYQAARSWVVFFAPANDPDIAFYNEFMNYLGDKQRAAVAKLDDSTTLFLVPPSEFSEKVLKVPGKLSMSGVILRLDAGGYEQPHEHDKKDADGSSFYPASPSTMPYPPSSSGSKYSASYPMIIDKGAVPRNSSYPASNAAGLAHPNSSNGAGYDEYMRGLPISSSHEMHSNVNYYQPSYNHTVNSNATQEYDFSGAARAGKQNSNPSSAAAVGPHLQPEQLAQLASSFLGKQQIVTQHSENAYRPPPMHTSQLTEFPSSQFGQSTSLPPPPPAPAPAPIQREVQTVVPSNQPSTQDNNSADPETRLHATLQLAAALLKQIQQGKGN
ncbi:unnamed protein product [Cuscuta campestris]|uniref:RRM domain-containing protein n=1 Tax=Cuscuta campestris TaxID=132261 RepID=A0A484MAI4_9ASTE|nr:unnamed protein product [Cuscuta campestris]